MKIGLIPVLAAAATLWAQDGSVTGPTSGIVFDRASRSFRPVLGVPGAATIGAPLRSGAGLAAAWVSPKADFAIARTAEGSLQLFRLAGGVASEAAVDGSVGGPEDVTFSPSGSSALLTTARGAVILTGMPGSPRVAGTVDVQRSARRLPLTPSASPAVSRISTAVSDDGAYVLVADNGAVRVVTSLGENRKLADASDAVVAFAAGSHDAAIADAVAGVTLYRNLDGAATPRILAVPENFGSPNGVAFSADGLRVFLSAASARGVLSYDAATGARSVIECECSPAGLVRMGDSFRLNDLSGEPLWMLDASRTDPRIVFVPALSQN